ncbi:16S rRNA (guanine(527)-N(7))-methyltransferase RsmG [Roseomonas eburnea]|uniref:Ribosomal RNA small subunit methyltransferase G n=1 Tax=Neoroseomonas eburnea TaxID=1346889 RepID=A0A9X9XDJ4_9PROT|nr:16S rRNA (guanine(527)-N(7))-methyltransferase RsmG [Neoroseomonas eburnea]
MPPVGPDPAREALLAAYRDLLLRWNATINLVAAKTAADIDRRHIADSLQLLPLLPTEGPIADLGSGAGLPGLVLAAAMPEREIHLVESDKRKAAFLIEAAGTLKLTKVKVHATRIEQAALPPLAAVTARALAPLAALLVHAAEFLAPGGIAIFPKGRTAEQELTSAAADWHFTVERFASRTDPEATILRLSEISRAGH